MRFSKIHIWLGSKSQPWLQPGKWEMKLVSVWKWFILATTSYQLRRLQKTRRSKCPQFSMLIAPLPEPAYCFSHTGGDSSLGHFEARISPRGPCSGVLYQARNDGYIRFESSGGIQSSNRLANLFLRLRAV